MRVRLRTAAAGMSALLSVLLVCAPPASAQPDRFGAIDAYIRERMEATHTPGLSYAVVGPDGPIHRRSWGTDGRGDRVTPRTAFLWGSIAKPVTATAVMTLVQSGRLRPDDRVTDHLPEFRFGGAAHAAKVTIRHLLNQTAGLPAAATAKVTDCLDAGCPRPAERVRALDGVRPLGPPGTEYAYTSANYLVLTAVVEAVTKRRYADYLREAVLAPAGMKGAIADAASARARRLAPGHQLLWGVPAAIADGVDDSGAGYGYLGGDLDDLAALASFQLRNARNVLSAESVRLMRQEAKLHNGAGTGAGLGWRIGGLGAPLDGAVWHTGATPGYSAMLFLLPEQNLAIVVQQNLHGLVHDGAIMHVGFGAARLLAGGRPDGAPSASTYYLTVGATTALAVAMLLAAGRSALLLRRPAPPASRLRRTVLTGAWVLAGALPWIIAAPIVVPIGPRQSWTWIPDAFAAICVAATAGAMTVILRLTLAFRSVTTIRPEAKRVSDHRPEPDRLPR
nr:hypothetical protein GCM10010200_104630 [Actinomadura rugatobispora]